VLANVSVGFPGFDAREVAPMKVPDLMARRPIVLFGKYRGEAKGKIEVSGFTGEGRFTQALEVTPKAIKPGNAPIRWLWARKWVAMLEDELHLSSAKEVEEAITDLGLSYTLLTPFTSFVAIDSEVVNLGGKASTVRQPLPLPEGVSNLAVGAAQKSAHTMSFGRMAGGAIPGGAPAMASPMRSLSAEEKADSSTRRAVRTMIAELKPTHLGDTASLLKELDARIQEAAKRCLVSPATLRLRLTVDTAGKIIRVEIREANDRKLIECVEAKLMGLTTQTRPIGAETGTLELMVKTIWL
jgi:Ca-activated chloride channel family protein